MESLLREKVFVDDLHEPAHSKAIPAEERV
jgi:hypothetical protein